MRAYIIRRLLLIIPTLFLVSVIIFFTIRLLPGSVIDLMILQHGARQAGGTSVELTKEAIRHDLGLDVPLIEQYGRWLGVWPLNEWGFRAESSVGNLSVTPDEAETGEIDIRAQVSNVGDTTSDYKVMLRLDGDTLETKTVTLDAGASKVVTFTTSSGVEGYAVDAAGFTNFGGVLQGNLGKSMWTGYSATDEIAARFPVSFELGIMALVIALLIAFPIGIYSAIRQDTWGDYVGRSFGIAFIAIPSFWLATMVMVFPSIWWDWTPPMELIRFTDDPMGNLGQFIIPATLLGMVMSGTTMRMTRTMMLEVLRQDYIRTAWSKGLKERVVVLRHALRNALIPVVTIIGMNVPVLVGGAVILEQIFVLPGMGRLLLEVITRRDYVVLSGLNLAVASFVLLANLATDLTYAFLDPRIRYG